MAFACISGFNRGIITFSFPGSECIESPQDEKKDDDDFFNDKMVHKERLRSSHGYRQNRETAWRQPPLNVGVPEDASQAFQDCLSYDYVNAQQRHKNDIHFRPMLPESPSPTHQAG